MSRLWATAVVAFLACWTIQVEPSNTTIIVTLLVNDIPTDINVPVQFLDILPQITQAIVEGLGVGTIDIDECSSMKTNNCTVNETCINRDGDFLCVCSTGFLRQSAADPCVPDLCHAINITCNNSQQCNNNASNPECVCANGFYWNGTECLVVASCSPSTCPNNSLCVVRNVTSFDCICDGGFSGDECIDIDECVVGSHDCDDSTRASCTNTIGSFSCACNDGYTGNGTTCIDLDECLEGTNSCDPNANCTNMIGSFECNCLEGYSGDGVSCEDIDECVEGTDNCNRIYARCTNLPGSFNCTCNDGFSGDGVVICTNIDECAEGTDDCADAPMGNCTDTTGSYTCTCNDGYSGIGSICTNIDECVEGIHDCADAPVGICLDTPGSFGCTCNDGFSGDGRDCLNIDECARVLDDCDDESRATCTDTEGSYNCSCITGYMGNGTICRDIDECMDNSDNCSQVGSECTNTNGSFECSCQDGFNGNGFVCATPENSFLTVISVRATSRKKRASTDEDFAMLLRDLLRIVLSDTDIGVTVLNSSEAGGVTTFSLLIVNTTGFNDALADFLSTLQGQPLGSVEVVNILFTVSESFTGTLNTTNDADDECDLIEDFITANLTTTGAITNDTTVDCNGTKTNDTLAFTVIVDGAFSGSLNLFDILRSYPLPVTVTDLCGSDTCSPDGICEGSSGSVVCSCPSNDHDLDIANPGTTCGSPILQPQCGNIVTVQIHASYFVLRRIPVDTLRFDNTSCVDTGTNPLFVTLVSRLDDCGWERTDQNDNITYSNLITNRINGDVEIHPLSVRFAVDCVFPRNFSADIENENGTSVLQTTLLIHDADSGGTLTVTLRVFEDPDFSDPLAPGDIVAVGTPLYLQGTLTTGSGFLRLLTVYITPTNDPDDTRNFDLVTNSCPAEAGVDILSNGESEIARIKIEARKFNGTNRFYVHSYVRICQAECVPDCTSITSGRRRRDIDSTEELLIGPILVVEEPASPVPRNLPENTGTPVVGVVLGILAAILVVIGIALIVMKCREREPFKGRSFPRITRRSQYH